MPLFAAPVHGLLILDLVRAAWPVTACSPELEQITGFPPSSLIGRSWPALWDPAHVGAELEALRDAIEDGRSARARLLTLRRDDDPVLTSVMVEIGAGERGAVAVVRVAIGDAPDASWLAQHDALTGLANRRLLERDLDLALRRAARHGRSAAVLFIDLDSFKLVNDELGHPAGDEVLRQAARRLQETVRAEDLVVRYGGDEFVVALCDIDGPALPRAQIVAEHIHQALRAPVALEAGLRPVSASVGISTFPEDGYEAWRLLASADAQMYRNKREAKSMPAATTAQARRALLGRAQSAQHLAAERHIKTASTRPRPPERTSRHHDPPRHAPDG